MKNRALEAEAVFRRPKFCAMEVAVLVLFISASLLISSCAGCHLFGPYRTFSPTNTEIDFAFEYPSDFEVRVENLQNVVYISMSNVSPASDSIIIRIYDDKNAAQMEQVDFLSSQNSWPNFQLIKRGLMELDGVVAYEFEHLFDSPTLPKSLETPYVRAWNRSIFVDRNARTHEIHAFTSASNLDRMKDIQHMVDTWRWK